MAVPAGEAGLPADSIVLAHQIRTIAKQRLQASCGRLDQGDLRRAVQAAIRLVLHTDEWG